MEKMILTGGIVMSIKRKLKTGFTSIKREIRKLNALTDKNVFKKQEILLNKLLRYSIKKCQYYFYLQEKENIKLSDFPIMDKKIISDNFDSCCSINKNKYSYSDAYTGGSTGEPFHLLTYGQCEYEFGKKRCKTYGYSKGDIILACDGTKIEENLIDQNIFWKKKNKNPVPFGNYAISSLYLNDVNAKYYCEYILNLKPDFLRGYPSFIYSLACYFESLGLEASGFIRGVELTSETIYAYQIEKIKTIFGAKVYLQYGHTEQCICANTFDETYRYRVEPLYGYVEILDDLGNHVSEGEVGEVVVTTLRNYVMPLIRYRTGDFAEYGGRDERYVYLNRVLGRTQDFIIDENGNKILLTALIFGQHCSALGHIQKWQLEQFEKGKVVVHIIKGSEYNAKDEEELQEQFKKLGNVEAKFEYVETVSITPRGKSKMLVQHIKI